MQRDKLEDAIAEFRRNSKIGADHLYLLHEDLSVALRDRSDVDEAIRSCGRLSISHRHWRQLTSRLSDLPQATRSVERCARELQDGDRDVPRELLPSLIKLAQMLDDDGRPRSSDREAYFFTRSLRRRLISASKLPFALMHRFCLRDCTKSICHAEFNRPLCYVMGYQKQQNVIILAIKRQPPTFHRNTMKWLPQAAREGLPDFFEPKTKASKISSPGDPASLLLVFSRRGFSKQCYLPAALAAWRALRRVQSLRSQSCAALEAVETGRSFGTWQFHDVMASVGSSSI